MTQFLPAQFFLLVALPQRVGGLAFEEQRQR